MRKTYSLAGQLIATRVSGSPHAAENGLFYHYSDHLGSATTIADASGNVVSNARYYPFGEYRTSPASNITELGYTGHHHNDDVGLIYMNARYYVPGLGRFASADTLVPDPTNPQSYNRYSYVLNNPLRFTDPSGHWPEPTAQKFQLGLHPIDSLQLVDALNTRVDDVQNQVDHYGSQFSEVGAGVGAAAGAYVGSKIGGLFGLVAGCMGGGGPPTGCGAGVGAVGGGGTGAIIGTAIGTGVGIFTGYSFGRWSGEHYGGKNIHTQLQTIQRIFTPENGIFQREDGLYLKTTELSMHLIEEMDMWQTYNYNDPHKLDHKLRWIEVSFQ